MGPLADHTKIGSLRGTTGDISIPVGYDAEKGYIALPKPGTSNSPLSISLKSTGESKQHVLSKFVEDLPRLPEIEIADILSADSGLVSLMASLRQSKSDYIPIFTKTPDDTFISSSAPWIRVTPIPGDDELSADDVHDRVSACGGRLLRDEGGID